MRDKSIASIEYRKFLSSNEDIYPSITFCFSDPLYFDVLRKYDFLLSTYKKIFMGNNNITHEDMNPEDKEIHFEDLFDVTSQRFFIDEKKLINKLYMVPIEDIFWEVKISTRINRGNRSSIPLKTVIAFWEKHLLKCLSLESRQKQTISELEVVIEALNTPNNYFELYMFLHFSGTFLVSRKNHVFLLKTVHNGKVDVLYRLADVTKKRSTVSHNCHESSLDLDERFLKELISKIGCFPPYLMNESFEKERRCNSKQLKDFKVALDLKKYFYRGNLNYTPCKDIFVDLPIKKYASLKGKKNEKTNTTGTIKFMFPIQEFRLTEEVQAYPVWSFMAEIGGYAGFFLGFSILQVPGLLVSVYRRFC